MFERVLICGSRDFTDSGAFEEAMQKWIAKHDMPTTIIEGCAKGADHMAEIFGESMGVAVSHFPAQWALYGQSAGYKRNHQMLVEGKPDAVIAFSNDLKASRGTANMVTQARAAKVPVWIALTPRLNGSVTKA